MTMACNCGWPAWLSPCLEPTLYAASITFILRVHVNVPKFLHRNLSACNADDSATLQRQRQ